MSPVTPGDLELWGTPTSSGTYNLAVTGMDANGLSVTGVFPLKVSALAVDSGLSNGTVGAAYASTLRIVGGAPPYSAVQVPVLSGALPAGLSLNGMAVTGTPLEGGNFSPCSSSPIQPAVRPMP